MARLSNRLFALILFAAAALSIAPAQTASPSKPAPAAASKSSSAASDAGKLDINTASADQLKALKGIGDAYSKRIIDGRPYTAKNQLTSKGIIPQGTYNGIKDQIIAHAPKK